MAKIKEANVDREKLAKYVIDHNFGDDVGTDEWRSRMDDGYAQMNDDEKAVLKQLIGETGERFTESNLASVILRFVTDNVSPGKSSDLATTVPTLVRATLAVVASLVVTVAKKTEATEETFVELWEGVSEGTTAELKSTGKGAIQTLRLLEGKEIK